MASVADGIGIRSDRVADAAPASLGRARAWIFHPVGLGRPPPADAVETRAPGTGASVVAARRASGHARSTHRADTPRGHSGKETIVTEIGYRQRPHRRSEKEASCTHN